MPKTLRFVLNVSNFDAVVTFYLDTMGFSEVGGWNRGYTDRGTLMQVAPGAVIEVVGHGPSFSTPSYHHDALAIELDGRRDVDDYHQRLNSAGVSVTSPTLQNWGHYSVSLRDPVDMEIVLYADEGQVQPEQEPAEDEPLP